MSGEVLILIHANPDPWGHPTSIYTPEGRALPAEQHVEMDRQFEALLEELSASGEFVTAEALADPASATLYGWSPCSRWIADMVMPLLCKPSGLLFIWRLTSTGFVR